MDFDLRQWLLILGAVFIASVVLHGYFRARTRRWNRSDDSADSDIRVKLDRGFRNRSGEVSDEDDIRLLRALPNGGARVVSTSEPESPSALPEPPDAEPVEPVKEPDEEPAEGLVEEVDEEPAEEPDAEPVEEPVGESVEVEEAVEELVDEPIEVEEAVEESAPVSPVPISEKTEEKLVVMQVMATDAPFAGQALLELLLDAGMTHGEMNIFHKPGASGESLFSLASAVEPGVFDMASMKDFSTPGVTLFMSVHKLSDPISVLEDMHSLARSISLELGGEIFDETRSVMTPQTIEHCRQSIMEFQRRHSLGPSEQDSL